MKPRNHDRREDREYAVLASQLHQSTAADYIESLKRPHKGRYVVMPNGAVELIR